MPDATLLLATANPKKLHEMRQILLSHPQIEVISAADFDIPEPEETGSTFAENAELKARYYAEKSGFVSLADDSGLVVDALDGRPGVYSARYAPTDDERIGRLLSELRDVPGENRTARFECAMCLAAPDKVLAAERGTLEGRIATERRGSHGFGYDPIFFVTALGCHLAEAEPAQKNAISHRGVALQKMIPHICAALQAHG